MQISYISTLPILQELYEKPRDMARFQWYLRQMLGENEAGEDDVIVPITAANPMGRTHCLEAVNALLAIEADAVAQRAFEEAAASFDDLSLAVQGAINVLDDVGGGWTNRYLTEASFRMLRDPRLVRAHGKRPFVMVNCWTSESYAPADIRARARASLHRYAHLQRHGPPVSLNQILHMDGAARAFAGARPKLAGDELAYTADAIAPLRDSTDFAIQFACLFGDEAARSVGYTPQGIAPYAGFELALAEAL